MGISFSIYNSCF
jgi:hypothetical protein